MTQPRQIIPGSTYMLTRRTCRREYRLLPSREENELFGYALAVCSKRYGVKVHQAVCMLNHYHIDATDPEGRMPDFQRDFDSLMAKVVNTEQGRQEAMWSSQRASQVSLVEPHDIWRKLVYTLVNPAKAGLVDKLNQWPGFKTRPVDVTRPPQVFRRPKLRFFTEHSTMPEEATLELTVPEALGDIALGAYAQELQRQVAVEEAKLRAERRAQGKRVKGVRAIMQVGHYDSPETEATIGGRDPAIAAKRTPVRVKALRALRAFRDEYRSALAKWLKHEGPVTFPYGTFQMRNYPGVLVGLPPPQALAA